MRVLSLIFFCVTFSQYTYAAKFIIKGNTRTSADVIRVEIKEFFNKKITSEVEKEIERRIWNLRIFSSVDVVREGKNKLIIKVEERWTTVPIAKFSSGGGSNYLALGAFDINAFGAYTELGAQYEQLNDSPAGVVWLRKPLLFGNRNLSFGIDLWSISRVRLLYTRDGEDAGAFTIRRKKYQAFLERKFFNDKLKIGYRFDFNNDEVSEFGLSREQKNLNSNLGFRPWERNNYIFHELYSDIGQLNVKNHLLSGFQANFKYAAVSASDSSDFNSNFSLSFNYFKILRENHNFAWKLSYRQSDLDSIHFSNFLGGLTEVRGYLDGQFFDKSAWQNNIEYRFDVYESPLIVIQANVFTDQAKEGRDLKNILDSSDEILLSSGLGFRLISPKVFRLVVRLDYAQTHTRDIEQGLSFGVQQFF